MTAPSMPFVEHSIESAPAESQRVMAAAERKLGYLPAPVARLAASPQLLDGFLKLSGMFETATLDPLTREVVVMTIATRNGCHVCVAMHTARLVALDADRELIAALRDNLPLDDERLEAIRLFTLEVLGSAGAVDAGASQAFMGNGFTQQNALEVVLGIGAYTMSTLANRLTGAPLDEQLAPYAWGAAA